MNAPEQNLEAYIEGLQQVVAAFPDYHWDAHEIVADGDRLAVRLTGSGTHTGAPFRGVTQTGRRLARWSWRCTTCAAGVAFRRELSGSGESVI